MDVEVSYVVFQWEQQKLKEKNMSIDPVKLEQDIDSIPGICADGKKGIKKLFENHFNVVFKAKITDIKAGSVFFNSDVKEYYVIIDVGTERDTYYLLRNVNMRSYLGANFAGHMSPSRLLEHLNSSQYSFTKVASSPEEFYKNKFAKQ